MIVKDIEKLRVKSELINFDEEKEEVELIMKELQKECGMGLGLSAIQIGYAKRIFIINAKTPMFFINPEILSYDKKFIFNGEGCQSFPGIYLTTERYSNIVVKDFVNGEREYGSFLSLVIQHEVDHLNGILMFDREYKSGNKKIGRNDLCFCGSNKKYKKCCGK